MQEYPKMLYKKGTKVEVDHNYYDTKVVHNVFEEDVALNSGWFLSTSHAENPPKKQKK